VFFRGLLFSKDVADEFYRRRITPKIVKKQKAPAGEPAGAKDSKSD